MKDFKVIGKRPLMSLHEASIVTIKLCMANIPGRFRLAAELPDKSQNTDWSGMPDTGRQVLENAKLVTPEGLIDGFGGLGLVFRAALKAPWQKQGLAISVIFTRPRFVLAGEAPMPTSAHEKLVREMFAETWQYGHAWEHQSVRLGSVVLIAPIFGGKPSHGLRLDKDSLSLASFDSLANRREHRGEGEAKRIGRELLANRR
jgi:hypothetical protein